MEKKHKIVLKCSVLFPLYNNLSADLARHVLVVSSHIFFLYLYWWSSLISGRYECKLRQGQSVFRQIARGIFTIKERPLIQVTPIRRKVKCENGKQVELQCSVQSPYKVTLKNSSDAGEPLTTPGKPQKADQLLWNNLNMNAILWQLFENMYRLF